MVFQYNACNPTQLNTDENHNRDCIPLMLWLKKSSWEGPHSTLEWTKVKLVLVCSSVSSLYCIIILYCALVSLAFISNTMKNPMHWSFPESACARVTIGAEIMRLSRQLDVVNSAKYSRTAQVVGLQKWSGTYLPRTCIKVLTVPCPIVFQQINTIVKCWEVTKVIIRRKKIIVQRQNSFKWAFH